MGNEKQTEQKPSEQDYSFLAELHWPHFELQILKFYLCGLPSKINTEEKRWINFQYNLGTQ